MTLCWVELRKIRHDRTELYTRAIQPAPWLLIYGETFTRIHAIPTPQGISYLAYLAPGILAQSALFIAIFYGIQIIWERDAGVLTKLMVTPTPRAALITGKAFAAGVRSVVQGVVVVILSALLGVTLTGNPLKLLAAAVLLVLGSAFFSCLSMSIAGIALQRDRLMGIGQAITMPLFFSSSALYPTKVMPGWPASRPARPRLRVRDVEARTGQLSGGLRASGSYLLTGSLAGVNAAITGYPVFAAQALRYTLATMVLAAACWAQARRHPLDGPRVRPTRRVVTLLVLQATVGVTGFNYCTAEAVRYTGAATVGTVIATVPVVLAIAAPLSAGRRPAARVIAAALLVAAGAGIVTGLGGTNPRGLLLSLGALVAEVSFTLVAVPLLPIFGPLRASAWVSGCSVPVLFALAFATGGAGAVPVPGAGQAAAIGYLAVVVCAGGFYLLYSALPRLGAERVGLFAGLVPFGAMGAELLLGAGTVGPADVAGAVLVAAGVALPFSGGAGGRGTQKQQEEDTAAAPRQSRTRTGAPRA